jgi:hypothetical protein
LTESDHLRCTKVFRVIAVALTCLISFHSGLLKATVTIHGNADGGIISRHLYDHFAGHLGRCIYDGIWVGKDSSISQYAGHAKRRRPMSSDWLCETVSLQARCSFR